MKRAGSQGKTRLDFRSVVRRARARARSRRDETRFGAAGIFCAHCTYYPWLAWCVPSLPLTFEITEGQRHDNQPAQDLVARARSRCLIGDKAYDSNALRAALDEQRCLAVIPSNGSRAQKLPYDEELYKARSEVECTFNLLKQARRFATRYEKTLRNYAAVVAIGCALLWLRI